MKTRAILATAHAVLLIFAICPAAFSQDDGTSVRERLSQVHLESPGEVDSAESRLWEWRFADPHLFREEGDDDSSTGPATTTDAGQSITTASEWKLYTGPYLWMADYHGVTTIDGMRTSSTERFQDVVKKTDFSWVYKVFLAKDDWAFLFNAQLFRFEDDAAIPGLGTIDITISQAMVEVQVAHRLLQVPFSSEEGGPGLDLWGTVGNRYWLFRTEIDGPGAFPDVDEQLDWLDIVVGGIVRLDVFKGLSIWTSADFGGFDIGSRYTTHFTSVAAYRISSLLWKEFPLNLDIYGGYSLIDVKWVSPDGRDELDFQMRGPIFGLTLNWEF
ncbi:MAG: hypothetical protein O7H41_13325 [Planctomycetota bacterium]|nr:hypothetical protein [Planctomycetota bacterium]